MDDFPKIDVGGKELFLVGCRKCDRSNQKWRVYTDGEVFVCRCVCGHAIVLDKARLVDKPDFDLRLIKKVVFDVEETN